MPQHDPVQRIWSGKYPPAKDVDDFIKASPKETQAKLKEFRTLIRSVVPRVEEKISYRMPTFVYRGKPFAAIAGYKNHIGFYPMSGTFLDGFKDDLKDFSRSKGGVQFPLSKPLPVSLIKKLIKARIKGIQVQKP